MFAGTDWTTVFVAAITGATALVGTGVTLLLHFSEQRQERESVRAALLAEVSALAHLMRENGYIDEIRTGLQNLQLRLATGGPFGYQEVLPMYYSIPGPDTYNLIYRENLGRLGSLKPLEAEWIVLFYHLLQSVIADVTSGGYLYEGTKEVDKVQSTIGMLSRALDLASQLGQKRSMWTFCGRGHKVKEPAKSL